MIYHKLSITNRYSVTIYKQQTPEKFGGSQGYSWTLRDSPYSRNVVIPEGWSNSLQDCKRKAMLAFILWMAIRLVRNTDDPRDMDMEFLNV
jgi:hypothetical protein